MSILIIADDLTGAADSAAQFRRAGFSAIVLAGLPNHRAQLWRSPVMSLSLNTRDASPVRVRQIWKRHAATITMLAQGALVYQKIDSTLRGHPALEVRLLLDALGASAALIVPAYPKLGRQTIDGVHRVYGVPLAETEYARAPTRKPATSHLAELFRDDDALPPMHLPLRVIEGGQATVADWLEKHLEGPGRMITAEAADERHLDILTQAALPHAGRLLMVGSAGWAEHLALACKDHRSSTPRPPGVLGVVGSISSVTTRQVQAAVRAGVMVVPAEAASDRQPVTDTLTRGQALVLWSNPGELPISRQGGQRALQTLARHVREILDTTPVGGLAIIGGETAQSVLRALRASGLVLVGEVTPGLPYGRLLDGPFAGLPTATKAGGFGIDTALFDCLEFLHRWTL